MSATIECRLCPKRCKLAENERGNCRVRVNRAGELVTLVYGKPVSLHIDPVEKKPLYHFQPGTPTFSLATAGCNLHCAHCQNWQISQLDPEQARTEDFPPERLVAIARDRRCASISYTYTEPIIFFEYAYDTSVLAHRAGIKNILVTAGYIEQEPLLELCAVTDAANVDLKAFSDRFYREIVDGRLQPVLDCIETMHRQGVWVEITNLIIPGENDDMGMIAEMCAWIRERLGPTVPLHLSRFTPRYRMSERLPTPPQTLMNAAETAVKAGLKHVYVGNLPGGDFSHTWCPACSKKLIGRRGYELTERHIDAEGHCAFCGETVNGIWR